MAENKNYNPFSMLGNDDDTDDVVNERIMRNIQGMMDDIGFHVEGNKIVLNNKRMPEQKEEEQKK